MSESLKMPDGHIEELQPDCIVSVDRLQFFVVEIKTPQKYPKDTMGDELKIHCELKLMLDILLQNGVEDPEVIGFLVQGTPLILLDLHSFGSLISNLCRPCRNRGHRQSSVFEIGV
jgi:hypothetical protein